MDPATDILEHVAEIKARGEPFALATVIRTVAATAAKAGAKAVILPDGTISEGWIGGGGGRAAGFKAAKDGLSGGQSLLVSGVPPDVLGKHGWPGRGGRGGGGLAPNTCPCPR